MPAGRKGQGVTVSKTGYAVYYEGSVRKAGPAGFAVLSRDGEREVQQYDGGLLCKAHHSTNSQVSRVYTMCGVCKQQKNDRVPTIYFWGCSEAPVRLEADRGQATRECVIGWVDELHVGSE